MKDKILWFIIFITLSFSSCKTRISNTVPDLQEDASKQTVKELSVINLPIEIPIPALEKEINRQFESLIYEDVSYDKPEVDDVMVRIWKTRAIKIQAYNEFIKYDVPIKIWASYRWKACEACPKIEKSTEFNMTVSFASKMMLHNDWTFKTQTVPAGFTFESKPKLDFGIVSIPITSIVEPIVKEQLAEVTKEIDSEVALSFDFSKEVDTVWRELHQPWQIDSTYNTWLRMQPKEAFVSPIRGTGERIVVTAGFKGLFEVIVGKKPEITPQNPLPLLKTNENVPKDFSFYIESFVDFESASKIACMHLKDTVLELTAKKKVKIDSIGFYGAGNKVFTKVDISGSLNGSVYFMGTPAYDKARNLIYFSDFDFDIKSKNALVKSANWLLHGALKNRVEKEFNYSVTEDLQMARATATALLSGYNFDNIFMLKGKLNALDIKDISVEQNGLKVIIYSTGNAQIKFTSLEF